MPPRYPKPAREVAVALRAQGIYPKEITRRLNEDQAGLGYKVGVSERTVKDWLSAHKREHGPFVKPAQEDVDADSIVKWKGRAFALICREIHALESKHPGKLSIDQSRLLRQHFETLDSMERISEKAATRRRQPSRAKRAGAAAEPSKPKSALEQLAEEEANGEAVHPDPPTSGTQGETQRSVPAGATEQTEEQNGDGVGTRVMLSDDRGSSDRPDPLVV